MIPNKQLKRDCGYYQNLAGAGLGTGEKMVLTFPSESPAKTLKGNDGKKKEREGIRQGNVH